MARNDIRLRRQRMTTGNIARHRNYGDIMERHERDQKWKRMFKVFIYFLVAAFLTIILIIVLRWEQRENKDKNASTNKVIELASSSRLS
jgi:preprotein translocase subunit SecG